MKTTFYAYKNRSTYIGLSAGFIILFVSTLLPLILSEPGDIEISWILVFPIIFVGFFYYVMISSLLKMFIIYKIHTSSLTITKPPFHRRVIWKKEIESIEYLDEETTRKMLDESIMAQNQYGQDSDIIGYIQLLKRESPYYTYYTLIPTAKVIAVGPKERITSLNVKAGTGMIQIKLNSGEMFYLTPETPQLFIETVHKLKLIDPINNK